MKYQSFVARLRRVDLIEFLDIAEALQFDPREAIKRLRSVVLCGAGSRSPSGA